MKPESINAYRSDDLVILSVHGFCRKVSIKFCYLVSAGATLRCYKLCASDYRTRARENKESKTLP